MPTWIVDEDQVIVRPVDGAQAPRHLHVGQDVYKIGAVDTAALGDQDLVENELEIGSNEGDHFIPRSLQTSAPKGKTGVRSNTICRRRS